MPLINARTNVRLYFSAMHCLISFHFKTFMANIYEISIFILSRKLLRMPLHYDLGKSATNEFLFAFIEVVGASTSFDYLKITSVKIVSFLFLLNGKITHFDYPDNLNLAERFLPFNKYLEISVQKGTSN